MINLELMASALVRGDGKLEVRFSNGDCVTFDPAKEGIGEFIGEFMLCCAAYHVPAERRAEVTRHFLRASPAQKTQQPQKPEGAL